MTTAPVENRLPECRVERAVVAVHGRALAPLGNDEIPPTEDSVPSRLEDGNTLRGTVVALGKSVPSDKRVMVY